MKKKDIKNDKKKNFIIINKYVSITLIEFNTIFKF